MSGRDRQRSASYYTPEVLTRCVVKHSLAELLTDDMAAARLLTLTICEPALGSGAFVNEAVNQLAAEYLRRAQAEQGDVLDPEGYHLELQKVKAHLALNNAYGVDLNPTAVELAEVSVWLNVMRPGLATPWFGLRLRRGNSLIGVRRATYSTKQLPKGGWKDLSPHDRPLAQYPLCASIAEGEVHHFLLPAHGWAASADKKGGQRAASRRRDAAAGVAQDDAQRTGRARREAPRSQWRNASRRCGPTPPSGSSCCTAKCATTSACTDSPSRTVRPPRPRPVAISPSANSPATTRPSDACAS